MTRGDGRPPAVLPSLLPAPAPGRAGEVLRLVRDALDATRPGRRFDRPIFIVAAPRSGSTLLLDLLAEHPALWSWFGEASEAWIRAAPEGHPQSWGDSWPDWYATEQTRRRAEALLVRMGHLSRQRERGIPAPTDLWLRGPVRYLDKTPANSMRVHVLAALWPDATFIHLHRDGPSNVASLVEAWPSPLGVREPFLPNGQQVEWRMLLPRGWSDHLDASVAEKCAFQWVAANEAILAGLDGVDPARRTVVRYADLVADPLGTARRLCDFCEVDLDPAVERFCSELPLSRVVLSAPSAQKWREREDELRPALPMLEAMSRCLGYPVDW